METYTIERRRIPSTDPRLGRHVRHDSRSLQYLYRARRATTLVTVQHGRDVPVFDQGDLGSCTGNAGLGALGTDPLYQTVTGLVPFTEAEAVVIYGRATQLDDASGTYPPDDTGSDGLSVAKALQGFGLISGYLHATTLEDTLAALQDQPVIVGVNWYQNMFNPDADGLVSIAADDTLAGGHEFVLDGYDAAKQWVWFTNSWGTSWGVEGRAAMTVATLKRLLSEEGDCTIFTPITAPAPQPTPAPVPPTPPAPGPTPGPVDADVLALAKAVRTWRHRISACLGAKSAQKAVNTFLSGRGL